MRIRFRLLLNLWLQPLHPQLTTIDILYMTLSDHCTTLAETLSHGRLVLQAVASHGPRTLPRVTVTLGIHSTHSYYPIAYCKCQSVTTNSA